MLEPKKQQRSSRPELPPTKYCENTNCGHKLPPRKARNGATYCDSVCRNEHRRILLMEQRPAQIHCTNCNTPLDSEKYSPEHWERSLEHFCDAMCVDEWRRKNGNYKVMGAQGIKAIKEYKEKHGHVHSHINRSKAVVKNNIEAPPKSKNFDRQGKAYGYKIAFQGTGDDYIVSVPELPELTEFHARTKLAGLRMVRTKMLELRAAQRNLEQLGNKKD